LELLAVLLALLVLATPGLAIYAVWRQRKLRRQIEQLAQLSSQQIDALHRELLELRRQLAAFPQGSGTPVTSAEPGPHFAVSAETPKPPEPVPSSVPAPAVKPAPSPAPADLKPSAPGDKTQPVLCPWCSTVHAGGVSNCPTARPVARPTETPRAEPTPPPVSPRAVEVPVRASTPVEPMAPAANKSTERIVAATRPDVPAVSSSEQASAPPTSALRSPISATPATPPPSATPPPAAHEHFTPPRTPAAPTTASARVINHHSSPPCGLRLRRQPLSSV